MPIATSACFVVASLGLLLSAPALAADWGYDEPPAQPKEVEPMRATALPMGGQKSAARASSAPKAVSGSSSAKSAASSNAAAKAVLAPAKSAAPTRKPTSSRAVNSLNSAKKDDNSLARECWAQIYQVAADKELTADQRARLNELLNRRLAGSEAERSATRAVTKFWPKLTSYLLAHPDQKPAYAALLKALLRWRARGQSEAAATGKPGDIEVEENALTADILGPLRLAVPGTIQFSEEAIDAYADMACFIYEQKNPGKTIDAIDNRAVFATVVSGKFREAPSDRDREAMAAFDLSWAKFKIVWLQSDAKQREQLLSTLMKTGAGSAAKQVPDPLLDLVLSSWPPLLPKQAPVSAAAASPGK